MERRTRLITFLYTTNTGIPPPKERRLYREFKRTWDMHVCVGVVSSVDVVVVARVSGLLRPAAGRASCWTWEAGSVILRVFGGERPLLCPHTLINPWLVVSAVFFSGMVIKINWGHNLRSFLGVKAKKPHQSRPFFLLLWRGISAQQ